MKRWVAALALLAGACVGARPATAPGAADAWRILAAVGDTIIGTRGPKRVGAVVYVADSVTARALAAAARRAGVSLAPAPDRMWCEDKARVGRPVGTVVRVGLASVAGGRARVGWSSTCLMTPPGEMRAAAFGEGGVYEVLRHRGRWRVSRALVELAY